MDMAESHVVSALVNKRAEIAGMIGRTQQLLGQFRADLIHLDATIRLFAPATEPETIPAKRIRQSDLWFERGELSRGMLDARTHKRAREHQRQQGATLGALTRYHGALAPSAMIPDIPAICGNVTPES